MYSGDTMEVFNKAINAKYELPEDIAPGLPSKIYDILHRALNKNINERYQSCREMMSDLEDCLYEVGSRPNTRILEKYITSLFENEYSDEKNKSIEILKPTVDEKQTNPEIQIANQSHQKTRVINQRHEAGAEEINKKKDIVEYSKKIVSGKKRWIILISVLIILTVSGFVFVKNREAKRAKQPELSVDFLKKLPKIIVDDINKSMKLGEKNSLPEREPGK